MEKDEQELRNKVRGFIRIELRGLLEDAWEVEGGIKGEFVLIPRGKVPPQLTSKLIKECAREVAGEL